MKRFHRNDGAQYIGVSLATFDRALANGEIRHFRIGRRLVFTQEHLDEYLRSKEEKPHVREIPSPNSESE